MNKKKLEQRRMEKMAEAVKEAEKKAAATKLAKQLENEKAIRKRDDDSDEEDAALQQDVLSLNSSDEEVEEQPVEKINIEERWERLLEQTHAQVKRELEAATQAEEELTPHQKNLLDEIDKLDNEIEWTKGHIVLAFNMPTGYLAPGQEDVEFEESKKRIAIDPKKPELLPNYTIQQLEDVVEGWVVFLNKANKKLLDMTLEEFTPMAEYRLWNLKAMELYSIIGQLKSDFVVAVLDILKSNGSKIVAKWESTLKVLTEHYSLSKENADYVSTITDYLEKIRTYESFRMTTLLIPNVMVGLRHIWTMSSYYCRDDKMLTLLAQISNVFVQKVKNIVALDRIFARSAKYAFDTATNCANLLRCWKQAYLVSRKHIEESGVGSRWEFDRNILFNEVDHICRISQDIAYISKVFIEFENLFGLRLKAIITDPSICDELMKKVYRLLDVFIHGVDYDIFRPGNWENWEHTLLTFNNRLEAVESDAYGVIEKSISILRSAELGLALIKDIKDIGTRESLANYVSQKHENVLRFFVSEINSVSYEFANENRVPPIGKLQPAKIGAIQWTRLLSKKLKQSVLAFKKVSIQTLHIK